MLRGRASTTCFGGLLRSAAITTELFLFKQSFQPRTDIAIAVLSNQRTALQFECYELLLDVQCQTHLPAHVVQGVIRACFKSPTFYNLKGVLFYNPNFRGTVGGCCHAMAHDGQGGQQQALCSQHRSNLGLLDCQQPESTASNCQKSFKLGTIALC
jgi:hypothetical protein